MEGVGRIEQVESFIGDLAIHEEEATGFLCTPVGCPVRLGGGVGSHFGVEIADMGSVTVILPRAEEGVVVD